MLRGALWIMLGKTETLLIKRDCGLHGKMAAMLIAPNMLVLNPSLRIPDFCVVSALRCNRLHLLLAVRACMRLCVHSIVGAGDCAHVRFPARACDYACGAVAYAVLLRVRCERACGAIAQDWINFRRVGSTPDPNTFESIAIHLPFLSHTFAKVCPPLGRV